MERDPNDQRFEAEDGTVFDTSFRGFDNVFVAEDNTVIAKPATDEGSDVDDD